MLIVSCTWKTDLQFFTHSEECRFNTGIRLILIVTYSKGNALDPNPQQSQMGPSLLHLYTYCKLSQNLFVFFLFNWELLRTYYFTMCFLMCGHFLTVLQRPVLHTMKEIHIKRDVQIFGNFSCLLVADSDQNKFDFIPRGSSLWHVFSDLCKSCHSKNTPSIRKHMNRKLLCWDGSRRRKQNMGHERERFSNVHVCHTNGKNASHAV